MANQTEDLPEFRGWNDWELLTADEVWTKRWQAQEQVKTLLADMQLHLGVAQQAPSPGQFGFLPQQPRSQMMGSCAEFTVDFTEFTAGVCMSRGRGMLTRLSRCSTRTRVRRSLGKRSCIRFESKRASVSAPFNNRGAFLGSVLSDPFWGSVVSEI